MEVFELKQGSIHDENCEQNWGLGNGPGPVRVKQICPGVQEGNFLAILGYFVYLVRIKPKKLWPLGEFWKICFENF